jgi:hypothetical protein
LSGRKEGVGGKLLIMVAVGMLTNQYYTLFETIYY